MRRRGLDLSEWPGVVLTAPECPSPLPAFTASRVQRAPRTVRTAPSLSRRQNEGALRASIPLLEVAFRPCRRDRRSFGKPHRGSCAGRRDHRQREAQGRPRSLGLRVLRSGGRSGSSTTGTHFQPDTRERRQGQPSQLRESWGQFLHGGRAMGSPRNASRSWPATPSSDAMGDRPLAVRGRESHSG